MRVGFLFNHDQVHQVAHSLPIAIALSRYDPALEIVVATTNDRVRHEVDHILSTFGKDVPLEKVELRPRSFTSRCAVTLLDRVIPAAKLAIYRDNLDFFRSLDALVVSEKTSALLRTHYKLDALRLIHTRHGAGDRAIGFNGASALFDLVLVAGPRIRDRLVDQAHVRPERIAIVGYPKFDLIEGPPICLPIQRNGRPTVLYNPHLSPHLSSWFREGRAVLDFFCRSPDYNLIFAPHVMLFERPLSVTIDKLRVQRIGSVPASCLEADNVYVDLGTRAATDMTYTRAADLYLGDVSSQVYEFLLQPRPCIFLNPDHAKWFGNPDFAHWRGGQVITSARELGAALERAWKLQEFFRQAQEEIFSSNIHLDGEASSLRAARAISEFLGVRVPAITHEAA